MRKMMLLLTVSLVVGLNLVQAQADLLYVASPDTASILVLDPVDASVVEVIELEVTPLAVLAEFEHLFVAVDSSLLVLTASDFELVDEFELDAEPNELWADDGHIYLALANDEIVVIDAETLEIIDEVAPGAAMQELEPLYLPASPLCPLTPAAPRAVFQTNLSPGLLDVQCRVLAVNGEFIQNPGEIGIQTIIDLGVIHAVEIFSPSGAAMAGIDVCLLGDGQVIFLDADGQPREPQVMRATEHDHYRCIQLPGAGTLVLVE